MSLLTPAQLAAYLNTSERTIARMLIDGCPSLLVGCRRRFDIADVTAWTLEQSCRRAKMKMDDGMPRRALVDAAFTDACRRVQVRVTPSLSKRS
jgi:excisionase family DNA binding protein